VSLPLVRVLDTAAGNGAPKTPVPAHGTVSVQVTGRGGVPASGAGAVVLNVTVASPTEAGYLTVGDNEYGELGNGTTTNSSTPVQVTALPGVTAIAGGGFSGYAVRGDGTVRAWGWNGNGEPGNGTTTNSSTPVQVTGLTGVTAIAGGNGSGYAFRGDGTVRAWGYNDGGELGNGTTTRSSTPVQVTGLTRVTAIAGGDYSGYALTE